MKRKHLYNLAVFSSFLLFSTAVFAEELPLPEESALEHSTIENLHRQGSSLYIQSEGKWHKIAQDAKILYCNQPSSLQMVLQATGYPVELTVNREKIITQLAIKCE